MSALSKKRTLEISVLVIRSTHHYAKDRRGKCDPERLGGLEVHYQINPSGLLYRQLRQLRTLQDEMNIDDGATENPGTARPRRA